MTRVMSWIGVVLLLALPANAQQGTTELRGRVVDSQGGVLPGVTVTVRNQATGMFRETVSNADGTYFVGAIVPGMYEISAELQGFKKYTRPDVRLEIGKTASVEITLSVGSLEETVNVTAETPLVDVTSKEVGGNIESRDLVELPSVNRNFVGFIGLLPGIVPNISTESFGSDSVNVNGGDDRYNNYLLDGAANNDDVIGQRAGMQARTPIESVQEFQVLTGQFDAEFGRTTGAVVNAVTKQGTNQFRGSAFGFFQDASLTAPDYFVKKLDLEKPDTKQQQFGGTLGGPIVRDKAHFFFSLERVRIDDGVTVNVPSHPEFNDTTAEKTRVWNTVLRVDHQLSANNTWGVRWLRESSPQLNQVIGDVTLDASREEFDVDQTVVGTMNSVLASNKVNTLRIGFTREDVAFANPCFNNNGHDQAACEPTLAYQNFTTQQNATAQSRVNNAYQLEDTFGWFIPGAHGDHDIKFGIQYEYVTQDFSNQGSGNGVFSFATDRLFDPNDPSTYPERFSIRVPGPQRYFQKGHYISGFGQDKWRMNSKLTLSLGLRYDLDILPISEADNPFYTFGEGEYPIDGNNLAPRVGFAYDLDGGRTVLHGGYGLFYNSTRVGQISGIISDGQFADSFTVNLPVNGVDPGPENGQFPTSPFLANGPVVNRELLAQMFPPGSRIPNGGSFSVDNPDRATQYAHEGSVGVERQLAPNMSATAEYIHVATRGVLMNKDLNPGLRTTTSRTSPVVRIHPEFPSAVSTQVNLGETDYDALQLGLERRFSGFWSARVSYTLSSGRGNFGGLGTPSNAYQLLDDMRLDLAEGPIDTDRRHNLVFSGSALVPRTGGLNVSWIARAMSGTPFTLTDSTTDADRNGSFQEPLPSGSYSGEGPDAISVDFDSKRNGARGPGFFQLDLRLGYRLNLGGERTVDLFGEIFNVTNRANFANPSGNRRSDEFLVLTDLRTGGIPRTGQFGVRFAF
ncbi:MAG TPA: carboxypeptidase regulatory-like domain-containing protein [Vicinamibacterales bacterium]|nr:carboxypeptidase regulatory-like domain-containing protein [Vicinamibacterales bacterium]